MMNSMTGYAYRESVNDNITVSVEIKGYNSRFLDLSIHYPPWLSPLESVIRKHLSSRFARGKVEVYIRIREENANVSVSVNQNAALVYKTAIEKLSKALGLTENPGLQTILSLEGVLEVEKKADTESYWTLVEPVFVAATDQFEAERAREGKTTEAEILLHIAVVEKAAQTVSSYAHEMEATIKDNLRQRFAELLGDKIDENRILAETAVLLMKYTISEELMRLSSHLLEFRSEIEQSQSPGKKLDFLTQEINREVNTIGSKSQILEVSRAVIEMKSALENVREQLRNVE